MKKDKIENIKVINTKNNKKVLMINTELGHTYIIGVSIVLECIAKYME